MDSSSRDVEVPITTGGCVCLQCRSSKKWTSVPKTKAFSQRDICIFCANYSQEIKRHVRCVKTSAQVNPVP